MRIARAICDEEECLLIEADGSYYTAKGAFEKGFEIAGDPVRVTTFLPPIAPTTIYAIGLNYKAHAIEMGKPIPEHPVVTMKSPTAAIGHGSDIVLPRFLPSDSVDYECELAVVIGRSCKNVSPEQAMEYVAGYTVANDVSARDWQKIYSGGQWCRGKTFDTFCPLGPVMVTPDEIGDPDALSICTVLNDERVQSSVTSDMIFSVGELIAFLAGSTTLAPGTVILTGTPTGVGAARDPARFLTAGDQVAVEIEGIGRLVNSVVDETI